MQLQSSGVVAFNFLWFQLTKSGLGCHVAGMFTGVFIYADDILLLCPSRPGLQAMVTICEEFAKSNNMKFSTNPDPINSKTKCIIFSRKQSERIGALPIILNNNDLPWVPDLKYLGSILESDSSMKKDMTTKRGKFIGKINSLRQEFYFVSPEVKVQLYNIYTTSFYGSMLYNLYSTECQRFQVHRQTHRYLIEELSECLHPKVLMASRLVKFNSNLIN